MAAPAAATDKNKREDTTVQQVLVWRRFAFMGIIPGSRGRRPSRCAGRAASNCGYRSPGATCG